MQVVGDESQLATPAQDGAGPAQDAHSAAHVDAQASAPDDAQSSADYAKGGADNDDKDRRHDAQESPPSSLPPLGQALAALDAGPLQGRWQEEPGEETQEVICDDTMRRWTAGLAALVNGEPQSFSLPDAMFCPPSRPIPLSVPSFLCRLPLPPCSTPSLPSLLHTPPSLLAASCAVLSTRIATELALLCCRLVPS